MYTILLYLIIKRGGTQEGHISFLQNIFIKGGGGQGWGVHDEHEEMTHSLLFTKIAFVEGKTCKSLEVVSEITAWRPKVKKMYR